MSIAPSKEPGDSPPRTRRALTLTVWAASLLMILTLQASAGQDPAREAEAWFNKGLYLYNSSQVQDAITFFQEAIKVKPDYADAHYYIGSAYAWLGRWKDAAEEFLLAISFKPDFAEAHFNLGSANLKLGSFQEALESFRQAISIKSRLTATQLDRLKRNNISWLRGQINSQ